MSASPELALERPVDPPPARGLAVRLHLTRLSYGGEPLFEDLTLELEPGVITCLLGPSGVGKSTLLRVLAGLVPRALAETRIETGDGGPLAGRVAYMDQRDCLLPWLPVLGNVTLGARLRGEPRDGARARRLLARVGLAGRERDRPALLSGGMRQRAALARTLMEDRPVVLMDEPFSALDALTRFRLQALAGGLLAGRTVLLVTHDPLEALRLATRIHVLAGNPPRLDAPLEVPGHPPRDPALDVLAPLYKALLRRLGLTEGSAP